MPKRKECVCARCGQAFWTEDDLLEHIESRHGDYSLQALRIRSRRNK